jgi:hypothetical protein
MLVDGNGDADAGLYIGQLDLADGLAQLQDLTADGVDVYYDAALNPLLGNKNYSLGGGELIPVDGSGGAVGAAFATAVPEPGSLSLLAICSVVLLSRRRTRLGNSDSGRLLTLRSRFRQNRKSGVAAPVVRWLRQSISALDPSAEAMTIGHNRG